MTTVGSWILLVTLPVSSLAEQPASERLFPANSAAVGSFTSVESVRELRDGRLLVIDWEKNGRLLLVDLDRGHTSEISRHGTGPGEHQSLARLIPLALDSTLVIDPQLGRWLLLDGARVAETSGSDAVPTMSQVVGADVAGNLVLTRSGARLSTGGEFRQMDSSVVLRLRRADRSTVTIARIATRDPGLRSMGRGTGGMIMVVMNPLWVPDQALAFSDGWIALVRLDPYRFDWIAPNGRTVRGAPIPFQTVVVDLAEKRAAIARTMTDGSRPELLRPEAYPEWPAMVPAISRDALTAASDGRLVVQRFPTRGTRERRYDVIDRRGQVDRVVRLRDNERIVGFGARSVYVVVRDADDVESIRRHPWP